SLTRGRHLRLWLTLLLVQRRLHTIISTPAHPILHVPALPARPHAPATAFSLCPSEGARERGVNVGMGVNADNAKQHSEEALARRSRQSDQHEDDEGRDEDQWAYSEQEDDGRGRLTSPLGVPIEFVLRNINTNTTALNGTGSWDMAISISASAFGDGCSFPVPPSAPPAPVPVPALTLVYVPDVPNLMDDDNEDGARNAANAYECDLDVIL
ncbi:hypothetical protein CVT25_007883, partial [Psilocybe cyanescens]